MTRSVFVKTIIFQLFMFYVYFFFRYLIFSLALLVSLFHHTLTAEFQSCFLHLIIKLQHLFFSVLEPLRNYQNGLRDPFLARQSYKYMWSLSHTCLKFINISNKLYVVEMWCWLMLTVVTLPDVTLAFLILFMQSSSYINVS